MAECNGCGRTIDDKYEIFRGYCNIRPPKPVSDDFLMRQDAVLQE